MACAQPPADCDRQLRKPLHSVAILDILIFRCNESVGGREDDSLAEPARSPSFSDGGGSQRWRVSVWPKPRLLRIIYHRQTECWRGRRCMGDAWLRYSGDERARSR